MVKCLEAAKPNLPAKPVKEKGARPATAPAASSSQPESDISPDEPSETESAVSSAPSAGSNKPVAVKGKAKVGAGKKVSCLFRCLCFIFPSTGICKLC